MGVAARFVLGLYSLSLPTHNYSLTDIPVIAINKSPFISTRGTATSRTFSDLEIRKPSTRSGQACILLGRSPMSYGIFSVTLPLATSPVSSFVNTSSHSRDVEKREGESF
jgi:hypothetical protein